LLDPQAAVIATPAVVLLLAAGEIAREEPSAVEAELDACAERIEALKAKQEIGRELDRLLRRAQELAAELERTRASLPAPPAAAPAAPPAPWPEELRELADAWRDEADRLAAEIAILDVKIQDARRVGGEPGGTVARAALGSAPQGPDRVSALVVQRAKLAERRARAAAEAARLDDQALAAEAAERDRFPR
jgi:hypothetical protein